MPTMGPVPASDFSFPCADYADAAFNAAHSASVSAGIYAYDRWLNLPGAGTSLATGTSSASKVQATGFGLDGVALESWGSMGSFGIDFDWVRVAAAGPNKDQACDIANGQACVEKLVFHDFADGNVGFVLATNSTTLPVASTTVVASDTGFGCAPNQDLYGAGTFFVPVSVKQAHGITVTSTLAGQYARGTGK
jgi:hypothetical protein